MSKVAIKGADTGTGVFTLESPATNTDRVLVLPDEAGTVLTSASPTVLPKGAPLFMATSYNTQTISSGVQTVLVLDSKRFDTNNCYNNTGSTVTLNGISTPAYAFAPNVAGYYLVNTQLRANSNINYDYIYSVLMLNGVRIKRMHEEDIPNTPARTIQITNSHLIYLNGVSDYIQFATEIVASGTINVGYSVFDYNNHFSAHFVRAA
jgi:hypothetical protein